MVDISIIVATLNEERFIAKCLDSLIEQDYPNEKMEIIVVDGMSSDKTREIVNDYAQRYQFISLIENSKKKSVFAFNIGIKASRGKYVCILSAHAKYSGNKLKASIEYLRTYDVEAVGGWIKIMSRNNSFIDEAIVCAMSSFFIAGSGRKSQIKEPKITYTASGCFYKKDVFKEIGLYNEKLIRGQDMELNRRLTRAGGRILIAPDIITYYYIRSNFTSFCKVNFINGFWVVYIFRFVSHMSINWRHLVPLAFVLSLIGSYSLWVLSPLLGLGESLRLSGSFSFQGIVLLYSFCNLLFSTKLAMQQKDIRYFAILPVIFALRHIGYGVGSIWGGIKCVASRGFWCNWLRIGF